MKMRDIYLDGLPGIKRHSFVFDHIFKNYDPELHNHLNKLGICHDLYLTEWLMAFGCNIIPIILIHIYFNGIFEHKWVYFYKVILLYLKSMRTELLKADEIGL